VALDVGVYTITGLMTQASATFSIPECGASVKGGETACIEVSTSGCSLCDDKHDDDDDTEMIGGVTRAAFAGIMVAVGIAVVGGGYYVFRKRQEAPEGTHVLMED
jgi:hypothetical protein